MLVKLNWYVLCTVCTVYTLSGLINMGTFINSCYGRLMDVLGVV